MLENMERLQKTSIINKIIAMMLVITLTITNFLLIAKETYAILVEEEVTSQIPVEGITTKITNTVEKYIRVEDSVLLQTELNIDLQKDGSQSIKDGKIEIEVPMLNGKLPTSTKIINVKTGYKSSYSSGKLTITPNNIEGQTRHKIVYFYPLDVWNEGSSKDITWKTTIKAVVDNKDYLMKNEEKSTISSIGTTTSATMQIPAEMYKGNMYVVEGKQEAEYTQNIEVETSYLQDSRPIILNLNMTSSQFINKDGSTVPAKTYYKSTRISKNYLSAIFADENGKFELKFIVSNENGNVTETIINQDTLTEAEKSTYILITYPDKTTSVTLQSISNIKTVSYGLKIENKKVLVTDKSVDSISNLQKLEDRLIVNGSEVKSTMDLIEPTARATVRLKDIETISSMNGIQNIGLVITLNTNAINKDQLFENPSFILKMPEGVTVRDVDRNVKISAEGGNFTVRNIGINENNDIYLALNGKQLDYIDSDINTQIIVNANVEVAKMMANKSDTIMMEYTNNGISYQAQSNAINIISSNDMLVTNLKILNYNGNGQNAVLEKYSDSSEIVSGKLPILSKQTIQVPVRYTIINNYGVPITVANSIIARDINYKQETTMLMAWPNADHANELSEAYMSLEPGEIKTVEKMLVIPANLYYNEKIDIEAVAKYTYSGTEYSVNNTIKLATDEKDAIGNIEIVDGKFMIETLAQLGDGTVLKDNDAIYNEQVVKYTLRITNISSETISNINVKARQENGKIYDLKEVIVTNPMIQDGEFVEHEYGELDTDTKIFTIDTLAPNTSKELVYRAVTRKSTASVNSKSHVSISAQNMGEKTVQTIENTIKDADIKISNKLAYHEEVEIHTDSIVPISTTISNLTSNDIKNKKVRIYLSQGLEWKKDLSQLKAYDVYYNDELKAEIYDELDNMISNIKYNVEENYVEFNITNLKANKQILIQSSIYVKNILTRELQGKEAVYVKIDDNVSNKVEFNVLQSKTEVTVKQSLNISENQKVKNGENVVITSEVKNIGNINTTISIDDYLHTGLDVQKVTVVRNGQSEDKTEYSRNGIINVVTEINRGETIRVIIETKVNTIKITSKEIQNVVSVTLNGGEKVNSNVANIQIDSEFIDEEQGNPDGTYSISGVAFIDNNENGVKDNNEGLSNITVKLIDLNNKNNFVKDNNGNDIELKTNANGEYKFSGIPEGNYNVIFKYDTNAYELPNNSNVKDYIISNNDSEEKVAITNSINLKENRTDIDLQLVRLKKFNLQLDKYITKVVVKNDKETRTTTYNDQKLVREEISNKNIAGSTVLVEYTIRVSNIGELAGYATEIADYIPKDMNFNSELNTQWYIANDGNLYNSSLASDTINPGESKDLTLVLVKNMTGDNTGKTTNIAKITKTANAREYNDIDLSNNESTAEMLVNPATGGVFTYILVVFNSAIILLAGVYVIKKKVIKQ